MFSNCVLSTICRLIVSTKLNLNIQLIFKTQLNFSTHVHICQTYCVIFQLLVVIIFGYCQSYSCILAPLLNFDVLWYQCQYVNIPRFLANSFLNVSIILCHFSTLRPDLRFVLIKWVWGWTCNKRLKSVSMKREGPTVSLFSRVPSWNTKCKSDPRSRWC